MLKSKVFGKRQTFQWRKSFGVFIFALSSVTKLLTQFVSVQTVLWHLLLKLQVHFFRTKRLSWTQFFWEKRQSFQQRIDFGLPFFALSSVTNLKGHFRRVQTVLWKNCCSYNIISSGPTGCWRHKVLKKRQSSQWKKKFGLFFLVFSSATNPKGQTIRVKKFF